MANQLGLTDVLDHLDDDAEGDEITLGNVIETFGGRGYGPILLGLALVEILPTGAIPGVPTLVAVLVILMAGQMVAGRKSPWIPKKLAKKGFDTKKLDATRDKIRPMARRLDAVLKPRLSTLTSAISARIVGVVCIAIAALMPPLEVVPFASSIPALAIAVFGLGLSAKDGLLVLIGYVIAVLSVVGAYFWLT